MAKELSQDTKFTLSIQTMISIGVGIATLVGFYYMMMGEIQEAKELPVPLSLFSQEYPSKGISDFNWSPSYEQYKQQVGNLQENQDDIYDIIEGLQDEIKELNKQITNLRIAVQ
jgi:peptidoglycan hydrolase CwlO-like protein